MTLAKIFLVCIAYSAWLLPASSVHLTAHPSLNQSSQGQSSQQQASQDQAQSQSTPAGAPTQTPTGSQTQTPPAPANNSGQQKPATSRLRRHKKKAAVSAPVDCPPANSASTDSTDAAAKATPPSKTAPGNCPPSKTVVPEGGTTEPSIQLIGGNKGAEQSSHQRSTTDQLLGATEDNLKKVAGRQLSSSQQEMVNQIQQFMQQSKAAVTEGDMERGHNLALKAHLLSDELVKP